MVLVVVGAVEAEAAIAAVEGALGGQRLLARFGWSRATMNVRHGQPNLFRSSSGSPRRYCLLGPTAESDQRYQHRVDYGAQGFAPAARFPA